jgi:hypothetical protein
MLDIIWLVPAVIAVALITISYLVGIEVGRQQAERRWAQLRHPANWTYDDEGTE